MDRQMGMTESAVTVGFTQLLPKFTTKSYHIIPARVDKGRRVSNCPIVSAASPRTPLPCYPRNYCFHKVSQFTVFLMLIFIGCGQSITRMHAS